MKAETKIIKRFEVRPTEKELIEFHKKYGEAEKQ